MSEENKDIKQGENNLLDSDGDPTESSEAGYAAGRSSSNHSIGPLELNSKEDVLDYVASGLEVETSDILTIEELSEEMGPEQNSDGRDLNIIYEFPSDLDEETSKQFPQLYFDNVDHCLEKEVSNCDFSSLCPHCKKEASGIAMGEETGKEINEVTKEKKSSDSASSKLQVKSPCKQIYQFEINGKKGGSSKTDRKIIGLKYVEYSSDEFADVEDNARDSLSDSNESCFGPQTIPAMRFTNEPFPSKRTKQGQKNETREENHMLMKYKKLSSSSSDIDTANQTAEEPLEVGNIHDSRSISDGASCSYSLPNSYKLSKTFSIPMSPEEVDQKNKCNLPTIVEESESENKNLLKISHPPPRSKANPLKMKAKVGIRKDKCNVCRVRLGLCAIKCRCGGYYCAKHRYDKEHDCSFDYKTMGAEEIRRNNPRVIAEKVRKL